MPRTPPRPKVQWGYRPGSIRDLGYIPEEGEDPREPVLCFQEDRDYAYQLPQTLGISLNSDQEERYQAVIDRFLAEMMQFKDAPRVKHVRAALKLIRESANGILTGEPGSPAAFADAIKNADVFTNRQLLYSNHELSRTKRNAVIKLTESPGEELRKAATDFKVAADQAIERIGLDQGSRPVDRPLRFLIANLLPLHEEATDRIGITYDPASEKYTGSLVELIYEILCHLRERKTRQQIGRAIQNYRSKAYLS